MPRENAALVAFNRGLVSTLALARVDLQRLKNSAEIQTNWMPRTLGSMMLRPGLGYIGSTRNDAPSKHIPFVFATDDTALIELTGGVMRVRVGDELISRPAVSATVANGTFGTDLSDWTDDDATGATSAWVAGGYLGLTGTGYGAAVRRQQVTVGLGSSGVEHGLRIVVARGPVTLRVGSTSGGDEYIRETELKTGVHSLALTPTGSTFWIELSSLAAYQALVDSVAIEVAGPVELPTPWESADLPLVRSEQSADVIWIACRNDQQRQIERRSTRSWSLVVYEPEDGPFRIENVSNIRIDPSGDSGAITLGASAPVFRPGHVGALWRLTSAGQRVTATLGGDGQFLEDIRVTGVGGTRGFSYSLGGTWVGKVTLQRSIGEPGAWVDVTEYTANGTFSLNDELDNQIAYYRIGFKAGDYTSGTTDAVLNFGGGSRTGVVRITGYTSPTEADAIVLKALGGTGATEVWAEGAWSGARGWPSEVLLYEGRLWWFGKNGIWGSVSDAYASFDAETEGESGPISRTIGEGPVDAVNWALGLSRLLIGTDGAELSIRPNSFDEPLSPTSFNIKPVETQGSARTEAVQAGTRGIFLQRSGQRVYELAYSVESNDYTATDLTALVPEVGEPSIVGMAVQRQPDTRIHCVRSDGTVAVLVRDPAEDVLCWVTVETDGAVEEAVVLPGAAEDQVYYVVRRVIGGTARRYLERWALESECRGGQACRLADSHIVYSGTAKASLSGLSHLEGETVAVWADGKDRGTAVVAGGAVSVSPAASSIVVGLPYRARYKSTKLAYAAASGTALTQRKRIPSLGLLLADTHAQGLRYGPDFDTLDDLPLMERGARVDQDAVWDAYDADAIEFPGEWTTDARVCLEAQAPRPCTVLGLVVGVVTNEK